MSDTFNKKEREKKKALRKKEKQLKKEARKEDSSGNFEDMLAYVDENGILRDTQPEPGKKQEIKAENIVLGVPVREKEEFDPVMDGTIIYFDSQKGYGFIKTPEDENIFVHHSQINGDPSQGAKVRFEKEKGPKGWVAVKVFVQ